MFSFRINRIKISDTKEDFNNLTFGSDPAQLKLISFIVTENSNLPDMSSFLQTSDFSQKKALLQKAVEKVISSRIYTEIDNITDNHSMTFGTPGYILYTSNKIPDNFNWQFIAYENGQDIKEGPQMVENILNDKGFDNFTNNLSDIISKTANPSHSAAVSIARYAISVTNNIAKQNHDNLLGISYTSLNRRQDYIYGGRKKDRISDLTNNMIIDYSIFGYDE
jgi:hypothetical protein